MPPVVAIVQPRAVSARLFPSLLAIFAVGAVLLAGCDIRHPYESGAFLPAPGQVVYCPVCDRDLYVRLYGTGTSRTAFQRADYVPLWYDIELPANGREAYCPFDQTDLVMRTPITGEPIRVYYRDRAQVGMLAD